MKLTKLVMTFFILGWSKFAFAECKPNLSAPAWVTKNVYPSTGGTVNHESWKIDGAIDQGVDTTINVTNAIKNADSINIKMALSECGKQSGYSIKLLKVWHPDVLNVYKTIHVTVSYQMPGSNTWDTCHVYAQADAEGRLATTCQQGHKVDLVVYSEQKWKLRNQRGQVE